MILLSSLVLCSYLCLPEVIGVHLFVHSFNKCVVVYYESGTRLAARKAKVIKYEIDKALVLISYNFLFSVRIGTIWEQQEAFLSSYSLRIWKPDVQFYLFF